MRLVQHPELESGIVDISKIQFDLKSRDDIPQILRGLQHI
jgi:IS5 family transposase